MLTAMVTLVIGASCSGKSEYAERCLDHAAGEKVYLATMAVYDDESRRRVDRHRERRAGRNFRTVECPARLEQAALSLSGKPAVLLEGIGTLAANELFGIGDSADRPADFFADESEERLVDGSSGDSTGKVSFHSIQPAMLHAAQSRILRGIAALVSRSSELVIVSDEVNRAGCDYEGDTLFYQKLVGELNQELCQRADRVIEMVCGCPLERKLVCQPGSRSIS